MEVYRKIVKTSMAPGGIANVLAQLGAVKTGVAANEVRQALDSGVIDTVAFAQHAHLGFGSVEAGKWATTNLNLGTADCPVVVNTDALNGWRVGHLCYCVTCRCQYPRAQII